MAKDVACSLDDRVICKKCGKVSLVRDLRVVEGQVIPTAKGSVQSKYYCCCSDDEEPLVYYPGEGDILILSNQTRAEVVRQ